MDKAFMSNILAGGPTISSRRNSQASRIARTVVDRIRGGKYAIGERIPSERELASEFKVSRPIIREALSIVGAMDLLDFQMGRGAFVIAVPGEQSDVTDANLQDVVNVREVLETGSLDLAARQANDEGKAVVRRALDDLVNAVSDHAETIDTDRSLHRAIVAASGSNLLVTFWTSLENLIEATIRISPHGRTMSESILDLHTTLANGVLLGRTPEAVEACRELHQQNRDFLRELLG